MTIIFPVECSERKFQNSFERFGQPQPSESESLRKTKIFSCFYGSFNRNPRTEDTFYRKFY